MLSASYLLLPLACIASQVPASTPDTVWQRTWRFTESWQGLSGQTETVVYTIRIYNHAHTHRADIDIDGHMAQGRILAMPYLDHDRYRFYFLGNRAGHGWPTFKQGELLFEFRKENGQTLTYWGAMQPNVDEHKVPNVYFIPGK